jgi:ABC-type sugar transport system ATPase subunit
VQHALPVGDVFTILAQGKLEGTFRKGEVDMEKLLKLMGGGSELDDLERELQELAAEAEKGGEVDALPPVLDETPTGTHGFPTI